MSLPEHLETLRTRVVIEKDSVHNVCYTKIIFEYFHILEATSTSTRLLTIPNVSSAFRSLPATTLINILV